MELDSLRLSASQRSFLEEATARYQSQLTDETVSYLVERGLDRDAATGFRVGSVVDPMPGHEIARGRLSIPFITPSGVVAIRFRALPPNDDKMKYWGPEGQATRMFNTRDLFAAEDHIAICEGEMDALVMSGVVGIPAVGVAGVHAWKDHFPRMFADYERVIICTDNDIKDDPDANPGAHLAKRIAEQLPQAVIIQPPAGHDVNSWYLQDGREALRERLLG